MGYSEALTAALLNTLRPPTIKPAMPGTVAVSEGQLIRATVQQVMDQTVLLNVAGQLISAKTDVPLEPRQQVLLNVQQAGAEQITLQIIPDPAAEAQTASAAVAAPPATETPLAKNALQLLTQWGLPPDEINLQLTEALITHGKSVSAEDVAAARQAWVNLPNPSPADLNAVAFLQANKLPISSESVSLANQWLNGLPPIANQISTLQETLSSVLSQLPPPTAATPELAQLTNVLQSTLNQIAQWNITPDTPPAEIAARLESLVVNLNTPPEAALAKQPAVVIVQQQLSAEGTSAQTQPNGTAAATTQSGATTAQPANTSSQPAAPQNTPVAPPAANGNAPAPNSTHSAPQAAQTVNIPTKIQVSNPLHQLAHTISEALAQGNLPPAQADALHQLSQQVQHLTQDLGALQISNLAQAINTETGQFYLFPVPLRHADGSQTTAKLKIFRQAGHSTVNPENTRLALLLDLPSLGEIAIDLTVFKREISGRVLTGEKSTGKLVAKNIDDLEARLQSIGYHVDRLTTAMLSDVKNDPATAAVLSEQKHNLTQIDVSI